MKQFNSKMIYDDEFDDISMASKFGVDDNLLIKSHTRRFIQENLELTESKEDIQLFVDAFGQETYDDFVRLKDRIGKVQIDGKPVTKDLVYHAKHTPVELMKEIIQRAENREYVKDVPQELDSEGKLIPPPTDTKKLIYNSRGKKVYRITDLEDMIDISSDRYSSVVGAWCIAGRYGMSDGQLKVSQAKHYFYQYFDQYDLRHEYYVLLTPKTKYCILITADGRLHSVWNAKDNPIYDQNYLMKLIPRDMAEALEIGITGSDDSEAIRDLKYILGIGSAANYLNMVNIYGSGTDDDKSIVIHVEPKKFIEMVSRNESDSDRKLMLKILKITFENAWTENLIFSMLTRRFKNIKNHLDTNAINSAESRDLVEEWLDKIPEEFFQKVFARFLEPQLCDAWGAERFFGAIEKAPNYRIGDFNLPKIRYVSSKDLVRIDVTTKRLVKIAEEEYSDEFYSGIQEYLQEKCSKYFDSTDGMYLSELHGNDIVAGLIIDAVLDDFTKLSFKNLYKFCLRNIFNTNSGYGGESENKGWTATINYIKETFVNPVGTDDEDDDFYLDYEEDPEEINAREERRRRGMHNDADRIRRTNVEDGRMRRPAPHHDPDNDNETDDRYNFHDYFA